MLCRKNEGVRLICRDWARCVRKKRLKTIENVRKRSKTFENIQILSRNVRKSEKKCEKSALFEHKNWPLIPMAQVGTKTRTSIRNSKLEISTGQARQIQISKTLNSKRTVENGTTFQCHLAQNGRDFFRR